MGCIARNTIACSQKIEAAIICMTPKFQFQIAFSLLDQDLSTAKQLKTLLGGGDDIFLYSDQEKVLKFNSGVVELGKLYKNECRFIVVLHRENYGSTHFTGLEHQVIRNRYLTRQTSKTPGNILFIKIDSSTLPDWVPEEYIYHDLFRSDLKITADFIRFKLDEVGGELKELTAVDESMQLVKYNEWKRKVAASKYDTSSFDTAQNEVLRLATIFKDKFCEAFPATHFHATGFPGTINNNNLKFWLADGAKRISVLIQTSGNFQRILDTWRLCVFLDINDLEQSFYEYEFIEDIAGMPGWCEPGNIDFLQTSEALSEFILRQFNQLYKSEFIEQ